MNNFESRYQHLNTQQKQAVDTLEGPVMVVAGPGTGKTELLSVRAANILKLTDARPHNILCLTYTESGASAMRERLAQLIGPDAYKISVHTFHSFGSEIINRFGEYFYHGANFRPADELSTYEVLNEIFDKLPHDNPLSGKMNGAYTHLGDTQTAIGELKKSGLTPDELLTILDRNDAFAAWLQPRLDEVCAPRLSKKQLLSYSELADEVSSYQEEPLPLINYQPLYQVFHTSLEHALDSAEANDSTRPLSEWKRQWITKRDNGELILKDTKRSRKLRAVAGIYYDYLRAMQDRSLFDFDDMILRVVHAVEVFAELKFELQEQYQYIMVDEFQDTNDAQMRLVWNLTNAAHLEGRPNLLVVGDDDQAIYRFQGATLSNILDFRDLYNGVAVIPLKDNYRSTSEVLSLARSVITQGEERLETVIKDLDKTLTPHHKAAKSELDFHSYATSPHEYTALADKLANAIQTDPNRSRAVIARRHYQLRELLPYLNERNVPLIYDHQEDVLALEPIKQIELVAKIIDLFARQLEQEANVLLPEMLAHPAWQLSAEDLWQLSLTAQRQHKTWHDVMLDSPGRLQDIAQWLREGVKLYFTLGLEPMLDWIFGTEELQGAADEQDDEIPFADGPHEGFISPLRAHFFPSHSLESQPAQYLTHLDALTTLRRALREYRPDAPLKLHDFINFIDSHRELGLPIQGSRRIGEDGGSVELLTAHRSKGLEYDEVYIIGLTDNMWGETARSRSRMVAFPSNMPIGFDADTTDERLRLLYVALTRAKDELHLSTHRETPTGKTSLPLGYIRPEVVDIKEEETTSSVDSITMSTLDWRAAYLTLPKGDMKKLLAPTLSNYRLSATHLNNFLDVSRGGPELFLLQNLLRFPQAMSPSAAYGSSIHSVLQRTHMHLRATSKRRPLEDILGHFEEELVKYQLTDVEFDLFLRRGTGILTRFLEERYDSFTPEQQAEISFSSEDIRLGDARVTGAIDLIDIDEKAKTIIVTDYKTGKSLSSWRGRTEYEKIKLHHYRQQLMIYKFLLENSRAFNGYKVEKGVIEFVEPDEGGTIHAIEMSYDAEELENFRKLLCGVWRRICSLDLSLLEEYPETLEGIRAFEQAIIDEID